MIEDVDELEGYEDANQSVLDAVREVGTELRAIRQEVVAARTSIRERRLAEQDAREDTSTDFEEPNQGVVDALVDVQGEVQNVVNAVAEVERQLQGIDRAIVSVERDVVGLRNDLTDVRKAIDEQTKAIRGKPDPLTFGEVLLIVAGFALFMAWLHGAFSH